MTAADTQGLPMEVELQQAIVHHHEGRLQEAERLYRAILQAQPDHADANHNLGVLAAQLGQYVAGLLYLQTALAINPSQAQYALSYAKALLAAGQAKEALSILQSAMQRGLDTAAAQDLRQQAEIAVQSVSVTGEAPGPIEMGELIALFNAGRYAELEARTRLLLERYPDSGIAWKALGASLRLQDKDSLPALQRATALIHDDAEAHNSLGLALGSLGRFDDAVASLRRALEIKPDYAEAYNHLGAALGSLGQFDGAVANCRRALEIKPDCAEAHNNLGVALGSLGQPEHAAASYRRALETKPNYPQAHYNLGTALQELGQLDDAVASYRQALQIKPNYANARSNLLFLCGYQALIDPYAYLGQARSWEQACVPAQERLAARHRIFQRPPLAGRRLRVGYVSGDYRQHAVSYFVEQLFAHHDRSRIELFAYYTRDQRDTVTQRLQALAEHWVPVVGIDDAAVRARIEADGIDVLIDLSGHTKGNRLGVFARRAAPVQAHYLGYHTSTGLTEMDYWIGDEILTPLEIDSHFSEQVWRLPRACVSYKTIADAPEPDWRPAGDGSVWVGSFNNLAKLTPQTIALWARVLHALPEGRLLLKTKALANAGNRQRILDAMASHGVSADRIELQRDTNWADYMAKYDRLDIALDPVGGHSGGTITCDALWMGVPVISALGNDAPSRSTASMLDAIGQPGWIARSEAEYLDKVVALGRDVEQRRALRSAQRQRMAASPLCDARGLARCLENAYVEMFGRWFDEEH